MIHFFVNQAGRFAVEQTYLAMDGSGLRSRFNVHTYERLAAATELPVGACVFAAVDGLGTAGTELAVRACERLAAARPPASLLNHPGRCLRRLELLNRLHAEGVNGFRAFTARDAIARTRELRFPVFVSGVDGHGGAKRELLRSPMALRSALFQLRLRGLRMRDLAVIEFSDTREADGSFVTYAAFIVGDRVIPRHVMFSRRWATSRTRVGWSLEQTQREARYIAENPHESELRRLFDLGEISYGRIDYSIRRGRPQVWKIVTNPTIGFPPDHYGDTGVYRLRRPAEKIFYRRFAAAWHAFDATAPAGGAIPFSVPDSLRSDAERDLVRAARQERRNDILDRPSARPRAIRRRPEPDFGRTKAFP